MGDNDGIEVKDNNKKEELKQDAVPIQLIITLMPDGKINLHGPINNRILCYGLLEMAREIIYDFKNSQKVDLIKPTSNNIMDLIRRK